MFVGVTVLTTGLWIVNRNPLTNHVVDLGFFALGAVIITVGLVVQLRAPERKICGVQQALIGLLVLGVAGLSSGRVEPSPDRSSPSLGQRCWWLCVRRAESS